MSRTHLTRRGTWSRRGGNNVVVISQEWIIHPSTVLSEEHFWTERSSTYVWPRITQSEVEVKVLLVLECIHKYNFHFTAPAPNNYLYKLKASAGKKYSKKGVINRNDRVNRKFYVTNLWTVHFHIISDTYQERWWVRTIHCIFISVNILLFSVVKFLLYFSLGWSNCSILRWYFRTMRLPCLTQWQHLTWQKPNHKELPQSVWQMKRIIKMEKVKMI